jgi:Right handed beta helix region
MIRKASCCALISVLAIATFLGFSASAALAATILPTGIDSSGIQDDTAALQTLLNTLPDGSTLAFQAGGKYRIEGTLHVTNKHDLTIDGNGALFFATTTGNRTRSQWSFEGGSNIVVRNVIVKGANPHAGTGDAAYVASLEAQHAFNIWSTNNIELDHVTATDVYGDFVYIGPQAGGLAKNIYIHDSTFDRNGRQGISVTGADGVRIIRNTITDTRRATFDLEPNGPDWGALNVDIEDNTIGPGRLNVLSSAGIGPVSNIIFSGNTIERPFNMLVGDTAGGRRGPFTIRDNVATETWGSSAGSGALDFSNIDGLAVTGNTIPLQAGRGDYGVRANTSCNVVVTGNTVTGGAGETTVTPAHSCTNAVAPATVASATVASATVASATVASATASAAASTSAAPSSSSAAPRTTSSTTIVSSTPSPQGVGLLAARPPTRSARPATKPNSPASATSTAIAAPSRRPSKSDPTPGEVSAHALTPRSGRLPGTPGSTNDASLLPGSLHPTTAFPTRPLIVELSAIAAAVLLGARSIGALRTAQRRRAPTTSNAVATGIHPRHRAR